MRYLNLSDKAKENALIDYCDLMQVDVKSNSKSTIKWFEENNHDVFNEDGFLTHRRRSRGFFFTINDSRLYEVTTHPFTAV